MYSYRLIKRSNEKEYEIQFKKTDAPEWNTLCWEATEESARNRIKANLLSDRTPAEPVTEEIIEVFNP